MIHILLIAALAAIVLRDELGPGWAEWIGLWGTLSGTRAIEVTVAAIGAIAAATHLYVRRQGRLMDRRGSGRAVLRAERAVAASRVAGVAVYVAGVLALGTLDGVRQLVGDWVLLDEALCAVLPVSLFVAGWWSIYPIERRIREAILLRQLDEGRAVHPLPTRWAFVLTQARHQLALVLLPVLLIFAWGEGAERALSAWGWLGRRPPAWVDAELWARLRVLVLPAVQLAGVAGVFALAPLLLRRVWDTVRLGPGELRDGLAELCNAARVRVRDLLVWRTGGTMINGAVVGLVGRMRYILLTDALLESLTPGQVRAVTAHEVGHVRRGHMAWLAAGVLAAIFGAALAAELLVRWVDPAGVVHTAMQAGGTVLSLAFGLVVFGHASRRFEWQADAFAAAHLSGHRDRAGATIITPESVDDMTGALQAVADLNHVPVDRFSWRHGSIGERQARLRAMVGQRTDRLAADAAALRVKAATAAGFLVVITGITADLSLA